MNRIPLPQPGETPVGYADRVGRWVAETTPDAHRQQLGQYLTPAPVARFMANMLTPVAAAAVRILDPGAGVGVLSCALLEALVAAPVKSATVTAYELDMPLADVAAGVLEYAASWCRERGLLVDYHVRRVDFVLENAAVLDARPRLFSITAANEPVFDLVIANPPYLKIPKSDPRAQAAAFVVHGQPNLYALFMALAAALLRPEGMLVMITPRSYTAGPYFRRFREYFFGLLRPTALHLFASRREAFGRDNILQENVILAARRDVVWPQSAEAHTVAISTSEGLEDLPSVTSRAVPLSAVLDWSTQDKVLHIPTTLSHDRIARLIRAWAGNLHAYGLEISTGPVVPFRAKSLLEHTGALGTTHAPLLWMQHVQPMRVVWPADARGKPQYVRITPEARGLLVADKTYVLMRRFSAKEQPRRLTAAPYLCGTLGSAVLGLENHLNYIHRPGGDLSMAEAYGLATLLNSRLLDVHFRTFNGNTQVSATELRALPLPPLPVITAIGERALTGVDTPEALDAWIEALLTPPELDLEEASLHGQT